MDCLVVPAAPPVFPGPSPSLPERKRTSEASIRILVPVPPSLRLYVSMLSRPST